MLAALVRKVEVAKANITDPFESHRKRPLTKHLDDWAASLLAGGATGKHVAQTLACARRVVDSCGFALIADLSASRVQRYLAGPSGRSTRRSRNTRKPSWPRRSA